MDFMTVSDSITFAREIAQDVELTQLGDDRLSTEAELQGAVDIMNHHLHGMEQNERVILKASEVFTIPVDVIEAEFMSDEEIEASCINDVLVRARLRSFLWLGSMSVRGFGLELYGVDFIHPTIHHTESAFMPLAAAEARIKQVYRY
jgi:hypothetical protein